MEKPWENGGLMMVEWDFIGENYGLMGFYGGKLWKNHGKMVN